MRFNIKEWQDKYILEGIFGKKQGNTIDFDKLEKSVDDIIEEWNRWKKLGTKDISPKSEAAKEVKEYVIRRLNKGIK